MLSRNQYEHAPTIACDLNRLAAGALLKRAEDCERVGGMDDCVKACKSCAESCEKMVA